MILIPTNLARSMRLIGVGTTVLALAIASLPSVAQSQRVRSGEETARILAIEKLAVYEGVVTGEVRNKSNHAVRDVQLFVRYTWLWEDERNPGKTDPGTSTYHALKETIQPGGQMTFVYTPSPPLPKIAGGRFDTSVTIAGFTEIIPQP
ncbi:MAG TPA: hypothetical protein VIH18_15830 [Candidatus Binatia bacterium]|jgi:hypothetical protein